MRLPVRLALLAVALAPAAARADDLPYPAGRSVQQIQETETALLVPENLSADRPASLVLLLHGLGDSGPNLINALHPWMQDGYVVCAPTATDRSWDNADVDKVREIAAHLLEVLPVDPEKIHVVGFSNGGWNLGPLAFDDDLKPRSATWIAAGHKGGSPPRWARKRLGVLALAGAEDPNAAAAQETVTRLKDDVRTVECRLEPGLGHKWPRSFDRYLQWWMGVQEGRFTPGDDRNFDWGDDVEAALAALPADGRRGGVLLYYFDPGKDRENEHARALQGEVFMDVDVRHFGNQLQAVKQPWSPDNPYGVKETPAVVVLDRKGKAKKTLTGKITARRLASALRSVAPDRRPPPR